MVSSTRTEGGDDWEFDGTDYDTWAVAGGLYYTPVEQLTLGIEGQWTTSETDLSGDELKLEGVKSIRTGATAATPSTSTRRPTPGSWTSPVSGASKIA